jgi:hypothetical protein
MFIGPAAPILPSPLVSGRARAFWVCVALASILIVPLLVYVYLVANPDVQLHVHSTLLSAPILLTSTAVWLVYFFFKRNVAYRKVA